MPYKVLRARTFPMFTLRWWLISAFIYEWIATKHIRFSADQLSDLDQFFSGPQGPITPEQIQKSLMRFLD